MMDNLSTHTTSAVYQTFPAAEERRILRRLEFHYTPKHANWLNMVEIEIRFLCRQCLDRRIASRDSLETEVRTWLRRRTESGHRIRWMFSTQHARAKMAKSYPTPSLNEAGKVCSGFPRQSAKRFCRELRKNKRLERFCASLKAEPL
jgi:hypothetical protein